ncbi:hypothetical protein Pryu01_03044 [Paraliobacillus ryukyuensis]|uniref:Uncharacterized protein n=1 Tax=Paraliobacillus ryukyuensis TaxID=200904 RepID=A0A366DQW1_9BACI|nr:hypothetical protein [Paraliobacillus ryukyuensis]RBO92275.1 hypothetical protein DES48_11513 [Paraliobacillus ryukyuensis]
MTVAFQIILIIFIVISFLGALAERNKELSNKMLAMFLASLAGFIVTLFYF